MMHGDSNIKKMQDFNYMALFESGVNAEPV